MKPTGSDSIERHTLTPGLSFAGVRAKRTSRSCFHRAPEPVPPGLMPGFRVSLARAGVKGLQVAFFRKCLNVGEIGGPVEAMRQSVTLPPARCSDSSVAERACHFGATHPRFKCAWLLFWRDLKPASYLTRCANQCISQAASGVKKPARCGLVLWGRAGVYANAAISFCGSVRGDAKSDRPDSTTTSL